MPDNIKFNSKGELWVGIPSFRDRLTDTALSFRIVRNFMANLPTSILVLAVNVGEIGGLKIDVNQRRIMTILRATDQSKIFCVTVVL